MGEPGSGVRFSQSATVGEWGVAFKNERMTAALLDRLPHRCHILECNGESYRFRQSSKQTKERDAKELTKGLGVRKLSEPTGERLSFWPVGWLPFPRRPPRAIEGHIDAHGELGLLNLIEERRIIERDHRADEAAICNALEGATMKYLADVARMFE